MDVHEPDQLGVGCYQQNSDLFKSWRPVATIQGVWRGDVPPFPHLSMLPNTNDQIAGPVGAMLTTPPC